MRLPGSGWAVGWRGPCQGWKPPRVASERREGAGQAGAAVLLLQAGGFLKLTKYLKVE